ncbi:MAG TPA: family 20 glycosylhydrolase [Steroidobacter sp.]
MRAVLVLLGFVAMSGCSEEAAQDAASPAPVSIIPAPAEVISAAGSFKLIPQTRVRFVAGTPGEEVAQYFTELLGQTLDLSLPLSASFDTNETGTVGFSLGPGEAAADEEGYSLIVSPERIAVSSRSPRGLFYGAVTLWQLATARPREGEAIEIPALTINDAPRFAWRGLMLDSARHFQSVQFIERFIDWMALHKLNVLHWHLTDDQGWRLEIKKYPKLTSVGAWRVPAGQAAANDIDPATGKPRLYGGFYTQEQVREIVAYAASRHVTIVPEIDMPGHATAAIVAYPELGVLENPPTEVPADWGIYRNLFNVEESTFAFLEDVLLEVIGLFPGEYVHIGGDEAVKDQWRASARVQQRMRELGIESEEALQSYFVHRIERFLARHGRRLIGWDEILEGGLAPSATVMSWRGIEGAVAAATEGHDAVLTPAPTLYLDHRPLDTPSPPGRGLVVSLEEVYAFNPAPEDLREQEQRHVLGLQGNLWTEHIRTEDRLEYMAFPRAAAVAELGWSPASKIDWDSFSARLPAQLARYRMLGVRHAPLTASKALRPGRRTSHQLEPCTSKLVLSLEDDAPLEGERAVFLVDIMNPCWLYRDADLSGVTGIDASVGQVPFNFQIGDDAKRIKFRPPATPAGELEVRIDSCEGERIATMPLATASERFGVTRLPPEAIPRQSGRHDLCFTFTQKDLDPLWVLHEIRLTSEPISPRGRE